MLSDYPVLSPEWGMCFNPHPMAQGTSWKMGQTESRTGGWEERYGWGGVEDGRSTVEGRSIMEKEEHYGMLLPEQDQVNKLVLATKEKRKKEKKKVRESMLGYLWGVQDGGWGGYDEDTL